MIIYASNKEGFLRDVDQGAIDLIIRELFLEKLNRRISEKEVGTFWNSLNFMSSIVGDREIPDEAGIIIECHLPQSSKRIDFIISGKDENQQDSVVIVELKQWTTAHKTEKDGVVKTILGGGLHETSHPSYQAYSYAAYLKNFSQTIEDENIQIIPCAYLHNYEEDDVIRHPFYKTYLHEAPVFLKREKRLLQEFIKKFVKLGDNGDIMYRISEGKIRPSKQLADSLAAILKGHREFVLLDEQKLAYETALLLATKANAVNKKVLLIDGAPGTGKSVLAINLLVELTNRGQLVQYVTKNAAPREVYRHKLTQGALTKMKFSSLFQGSGNYTETLPNQFNTLVVDEAHRLNEKSGMFQNLGKNQIMELINSSQCTIFFVDEDQRVTLRDIGTKKEIREWAHSLGAEVTECKLTSQFRCNGSEGYLAFIDNLLQVRETSNFSMHGLQFDFQVLDSPQELFDRIREKNSIDNKARVVAGYCWDWVSKNTPSSYDIVIPEHAFSKRWNLQKDGNLWILEKNSVEEVGCIHTCQGLEVDYIGVIIGPDLIVRAGKVLVDPSKRSKMDSSVKGYKNLLQKKPDEGKLLISQIIKNTYRTLLTRGMKGCYVFATDDETNEYLKKALQVAN